MTVLTAIIFLNGFLFAEEATIFRTDFDNPVLDKGWGWMPSPEGKDAARYVQITKGQANLRALKKRGEYLVLISEYNHQDSRKVQVKLPDAVKGHSVWNLNERKRIGKVSGQNSTEDANLSPEKRAVMYVEDQDLRFQLRTW